MDRNIENTFKKQEVADYYLQGIYSKSKIFSDQREAPLAQHLTLDDYPHSIVSFLRRPMDIYNFKWTTNNLQNEELIPNGLKFPDIFFKQAMVLDKLQNFVGIRGKLMLRIKFNAQVYQQGVLLAYYIPNSSKIPQKTRMIQASLSGKSGCPGNIEIDVQGGTMYDIEVPYVSEFNYYNLLTNQGSYGTFYLTPYLQLKSTKQNDFVNVTIQAYWVDPQPQFATGVPIKVPTESEQERLHDNTLETGGSTHVTPSSLIDKLIPSEIKPSTVLQTGANLLQLAGYQKPNIETGICQSHLQTNKFMANYNGEQFSHSLGLSSTNKLEQLPAPTSTMEDEMNLPNLWRKSTYYDKFSWSTSDEKGKIIYIDEVYPAKFSPSEFSNVYNSTFVGFATAPFTQWKGSLDYHFKLAKTQYHSGSIRVTWVPGLYKEDFDALNGTITLPNFQINANHSQTYDIKETKEFIFTPPYTATSDALWNVNPYSTQANTLAKHNWCAGSIIVDVFTDLRANETVVVPTIEIAIRVSGGEDLQMMGATAPNVFPFDPSVRTEGITEDEGGHRNEEANQIHSPVTGNLKSSFLSSAILTGECVTSIKNFIGRQGLYGDVPGVSNVVQICPFDFQKPLSVTSANVTNFDMIDYFSYLFGWYAGGVNISFYNLTSSITRYYEVRSLPGLNAFYPTSFDRVKALSTTDVTKYDNTLARLPLPTQVVKSDLEGMVHLMVPYYNRVHITPALTAEQTLLNTQEGAYPTPIVFIKGSANMTNTRVFRSATDSFHFYYLLGPPRVVLLSGSAELTPFINPNVLMDRQRQTVEDLGGGTTKVGPFFQLSSVNFTGATPVTFVPNNFFLTRVKRLFTDPWSLLIAPANDVYNFTLASSDMRVTSSVTSFNTWNLMNASLSTFQVSPSATGNSFYRLTAITVSLSEPIKMSQVNSSSVRRDSAGLWFIPGINGNEGIIPGASAVLDEDILAMSPTSIPLIIPKGTTINITTSAVTLAFTYEGLSGLCYFIGSFGDDVKYTPGLLPSPYTLNEPL